MSNTISAILAVYGVPGGIGGSDVLTRQAAEGLAKQMQGKIIDGVSVDGSKGKRFRIVSARLEGDDRQGQILAECEVAEQE